MRTSLSYSIVLLALACVSVVGCEDDPGPAEQTPPTDTADPTGNGESYVDTWRRVPGIGR